VETIEIEIRVRAPFQRCFDAARDLDLHVRSLAHTNERAIAGRTTGLIESGEEVTWRGRHFGVYQNFTSKITAFDPPHYFQDSMVRGAFRSFVHDHYFVADGDETVMKDVLVFAAPFGFIGRIAEKLVLRRYLEQLLRSRGEVIKEAAEADAALRPRSLA
jgi:ligand-binding SRPBCC domain-containing protein